MLRAFNGGTLPDRTQTMTHLFHNFGAVATLSGGRAHPSRATIRTDRGELTAMARGAVNLGVRPGLGGQIFKVLR